MLCTIGVYGFTAYTFLSALRDAGVRVALDEVGIGYRHLKELAPTTDLRQLQYAEDARQGVGSAHARSSRTRT